MTNDNDWALVVGISEYPGPEMPSLNGPENDAGDFLSWLTEVGGVPFDATATAFVPGVNQAVCILTSNIKRELLAKQGVPVEQIEARLSDPFPSADVAGPTREQIECAFETLQQISGKLQEAGKGPRIGRRIYLYFSGHGIAPTKEDAAVLMADAWKGRFYKHIAGGAWANWFFEAGYFDETVLIMDCCRDIYAGVKLNGTLDEEFYDGREQRSRYYIYGAKWSSKSFEREMDDGRVHGVLSYALLDGLKGLACEPASGDVTAASLRTFLVKHMLEYLGSEDLNNADISKSPDLPLPDPEQPLTFTTISADKIPVLPAQLSLPDAAVGKKLRIVTTGADFGEEYDLTEANLTIPLKIGSYVARIDDLNWKKPFVVRGRKIANVFLR